MCLQSVTKVSLMNCGFEADNLKFFLLDLGLASESFPEHQTLTG